MEAEDSQGIPVSITTGFMTFLIGLKLSIIRHAGSWWFYNSVVYMCVFVAPDPTKHIDW